MIAGSVVMAIGLGIFSWTDEFSSYWAQPGIGLVVVGVGFGLFQVMATGGIMESVPADRRGVGSSVNDASREIGGAVGVAVFGSLLATEVARRAPAQFGTGDVMAGYFEFGRHSSSAAHGLMVDVFLPAMDLLRPSGCGGIRRLRDRPAGCVSNPPTGSAFVKM